MSGIQPVAVYAMKVPPGDIMVPAVPEFAAMFRLTMAAVDPSAAPELDEVDDKKPARATLKLVRVSDDMFDDDDSDDSDDDEDLEGLEDDESDSDAEVNGGPSNPQKAGKSKKQALLEALAADDDDEDMDDEDDVEDEEDAESDAKAIAQLQKLMKSVKGKGKALDGEEDEEADDIDSDDEDDEAVEMDEVVLCTLDPEKNYQQPLDFVVGEGEKVFFKVSGTHTVHLTGNYVIPQDDGQASLYDDYDDEDDEFEEDGEEYDLPPDEDELDAVDYIDEESDELDDLADPVITEVHSDEEVPKLIKDAGKGKNKRLAEDSEEDDSNLDKIMAKSIKKNEAAATGETTTDHEAKKLSKAEKKKQKKQKKNDGEAGPAPAVESNKTPEPKKESQTNGTGSEKKVQFAKNLEQGPTPSATPPTNKVDKPAVAAAADKTKSSTTLGVKTVDGVTIDDRKIGAGPAAKKGSRLEMRYIGKLESGKVFDSNKSGKPFAFKLGAGEVIKGWDIGMQGVQVGGERRLTIPAHLGYGKKGAPPDIPPNAKLIFDIKCLTVK